VNGVHTFNNEANRNTWIEYLGPFQMELTPAIINGTNPLINGGPLSTNANTSYTSHYGASSKIKHQKNQSVVVVNK
jgi:hypothetical protein